MRVDRPATLMLGHTTLAVRDLDAMVAFYGEVLGFRVTNRGAPAPGLDDMAFLSHDAGAHHQIVLVVAPTPEHGFVMADHLAFRAATLAELRWVSAALEAAGVDGVIPICHGNSWSLYFTDPEGNGLEVYVDTPFHVAQPFAGPLDLGQSDDEVLAATRAMIDREPEFQPVDEWRRSLSVRLASAEAV
jgi:catechol 2,3-dioxygenase